MIKKTNITIFFIITVGSVIYFMYSFSLNINNENFIQIYLNNFSKYLNVISIFHALYNLSILNPYLNPLVKTRYTSNLLQDLFFNTIISSVAFSLYITLLYIGAAYFVDRSCLVFSLFIFILIRLLCLSVSYTLLNHIFYIFSNQSSLSATIPYLLNLVFLLIFSNESNEFKNRFLSLYFVIIILCSSVLIVIKLRKKECLQ